MVSAFASLAVAVLATMAPAVSADYITMDVYFNGQCSGDYAATGTVQLNYFQCRNQSGTMMKARCADDGTAVMYGYTTSDCSDTGSIVASVPVTTSCDSLGQGGGYSKQRCAITTSSYSLPAATGPSGSNTMSMITYEGTTCSGSVINMIRYNGGCRNNGVNSSQVLCHNSTHGVASTYTGTSCTGTVIEQNWMQLGCVVDGSNSDLTTCSTISSASAATASIGLLSVALAAVLAVFFRAH